MTSLENQPRSQPFSPSHRPGSLLLPFLSFYHSREPSLQPNPTQPSWNASVLPPFESLCPLRMLFFFFPSLLFSIPERPLFERIHTMADEGYPRSGAERGGARFLPTQKGVVNEIRFVRATEGEDRVSFFCYPFVTL